MKFTPNDLFDNDKIIYENENFVLHIDPKNNEKNFHYTAWSKKDMRSLLEITKKDIDNILELEKEIENIIKKPYISYIHFPPNFWRLHIHYVNPLNFEEINNSDLYLIKDIYQNISNDEDYYRKNVKIKCSL